MTNRSVLQISPWMLMITSAAILMITMGSRQTLGLFVSPLNSATGLGIVSISFAMAVGQFVWGAAQPIFGAVADRYGPGRVIVAGGVMLALGWLLTPLASSEWTLIMTMGIVASAGAGAGSFSILIGATAGRVPPERRAFAAGFINAGGSFGQFVFAPLVQALIHAFGWVTAMMTMALSALATLPMARVLRGHPLTSRPRLTAVCEHGIARAGANRHAGPELLVSACRFLHLRISHCVSGDPSSRRGGPVRAACRCGGQVARDHRSGQHRGQSERGCLGNIYRMKSLLFWLYLSRAVAVGIYLAAPKTALTFYVFAAVLGVTWFSTVPPTAGLVGKLFGTRYLATLFGLTLLSHQIGGFFGAWLGGLAVANSGSYQWMWYADMALAMAAAVVNLPIREAPPKRVAMAAG